MDKNVQIVKVNKSILDYFNMIMDFDNENQEYRDVTEKEFKDEFRWLSNFIPCDIILDNITYSSVEHAYQSAKSDNPEWKEFCRTEKC